MKAATWICQQIFLILELVIFLLKILLKSASKSSFFRFGVEKSPQIALEWLRQGCFLLWLHAQCLLQLDRVNRLGLAA